LSNDTVKKINDANQTGKLKIQIQAFTENKITKTWYPQTFPLLFSSETEVKEFMSQNNWTIKQGLGTRSVEFTGKEILSVFAYLKHPSYDDNYLVVPYIKSAFSATQITPLKTDDSCSIFKNSAFKDRMSCDNFFNSSIIFGVGLLSFDANSGYFLY